MAVTTRNEYLEAPVSFVPCSGLPGAIFLNFEARTNDLARFSQAANRAVGNGLYHEISNSRRLNRTGDNAAVGRVGCHLAEQRVFCTAADNVNRLNSPAD